MFNPLPTGPDPRPGTPPEHEVHEPNADEQDEAYGADEPADVEMPLLTPPPRWPAVTRWSRCCKVLAFLCLIVFGFVAASNLYQAATAEPEFDPFMRPRVTPGWYLLYALLYAAIGVVVCISLLGFAELLKLLMAIEADVRRGQERRSMQPRHERDDGDFHRDRGMPPRADEPPSGGNLPEYG